MIVVNQLAIRKQGVEENAQECAVFFERMARVRLDMEQAAPKLSQLLSDFAHLRKGELIMGCTTQTEWSEKYVGKTAESLRLQMKRWARKQLAVTIEPVATTNPTTLVCPDEKTNADETSKTTYTTAPAAAVSLIQDQPVAATAVKEPGG